MFYYATRVCLCDNMRQLKVTAKNFVRAPAESGAKMLLLTEVRRRQYKTCYTTPTTHSHIRYIALHQRYTEAKVRRRTHTSHICETKLAKNK